MSGHVIAVTDHFGPTLYMTDDKKWVWGEDAYKAHVFSDDDRSIWQLDAGQEWKPASDLGQNKYGEKP